MHLQKICEICNVQVYDKKITFLSTNIKIDSPIDFSDLQSYIDLPSYANQQCLTCKNYLKIDRKFNDIIALDTEATKSAFENVKLKDISKELKIENMIYKLKGAIEYKSFGHFVLRSKKI